MKKLSICIYSLLFSALLFVQAVEAADYTNSIGMEFKNIPAGTFFMGSCRLSRADRSTSASVHNVATMVLEESNKKRRFMGLPLKKIEKIKEKEVICPSGGDIDNDAEDEELPQHKVNITKDFQMGVYEVTLGQFKKFILDAGRDDLLTDDFMTGNSFGDDVPVVNVSWHYARNFVVWLNKKEGGYHYRLPTEAEWEYAARAGTKTGFWWGDEVGENNANCRGCGSQWDGKRMSSVGSFKPNPFGLYDTAGNVDEWVRDCYVDSYESAPIDGSAREPSVSSCKIRVLRGGSWRFGSYNLRSANRGGGSPLTRSNRLGFRLARTL